MLSLAVAGALFATQLSAAVAAPGSSWTSTGQLDPALTTVGDALQDVIVSAQGGVSAAADAVRSIGGEVESPLPIIDGVEARVPASLLPKLAATNGVTAVTADRKASFEELSYDSTTVASNFAKTTQATTAWSHGNTGAGVGIAILDTGISPMKDFEGRLVHGPDLSGEGSTIDTYGHGTVMAGAAGGSGADSAGSNKGLYAGIAPKSTLVAVKVAGRNGVADVSTILHGMHWVSAYKDQYNIRVLNISWGTTSTQDPAVDPLNYAVQRLWNQGIVVVVAAGNSGPGAGTILKPADDPMVITVGAYDDKGNESTSDDHVPAWSSQGPTAHGLTKPDIVVPGRTLVTTRSYGSRVEAENPRALISPSYIRGSGTSQAAAVTSGLAALLIAARPSLTPDQVKHLLRSTAAPLTSVLSANTQGRGRVQLANALTADPGPAVTQVSNATGLGSLDASRGGRHVETVCPGHNATTRTVIQGEIDTHCEPWSGSTWTGSTWTGDSWTGSTWTGSTWTGSTWTGSTWTGSTWTGSTWTGSTWTGGSWYGSTWTGSTWTGSTWTGSTWTGSTWTGSTWTGSTWTGSTWTGSGYDEADEFLTAWWGHLPPLGKKVAGEPNDPNVKTPAALCATGNGAVCP